MTARGIYFIIIAVCEAAAIVILFLNFKAVLFELERLDNSDDGIRNALNNHAKNISSLMDKISTLEANEVKPAEFELTEDEKRDLEKYQEGLDSILNFHSQKEQKKEGHDE